MKRLLSILTTAACIISYAALAQAEATKDGEKGNGIWNKGDKTSDAREGMRRRGARGGDQDGKRAMTMFEGLELTEDQKTKIEEILKAGREKQEKRMKENAENMKAQREEIRAAFQSGDREKAMEMMKKMRESFESDRAETQKKIDEILTPEQRKKMEAKRAEMKEKMSKFAKGRRSEGKRGRGGFRSDKRGDRAGKAPAKLDD